MWIMESKSQLRSGGIAVITQPSPARPAGLADSLTLAIKGSSQKVKPTGNVVASTNGGKVESTNVKVTTANAKVITKATASTEVRYNLTIVTAFIDIGEFGKGNPNNRRNHNIYEKWSLSWRLVHTPVVFYTDSEGFAKHIQGVREHLPDLTRIVLVNRSELWAFQQREKIAAVYAAGYPKHWPNTVNPNYTCVTHAKFDAVKDAVDKNYFPSKYIAWMDAGYLRNKAGEAANKTSRTYYVVQPPPDFDPTKVMCGEVYQPHFDTPWRRIFQGNINWVAGGFFLGTRPLMVEFVEQYRRAVRLFLEQHESNVEQHVIYASYTKSGREIVKPTVELQAVRGDWFTLGFRCLVPHKLSDKPS